MMITKTAIKERIRRKEFFAVSIVGVLILLLFSSGAGTLSINGVAITDFRMLLPILLTVIQTLTLVLTTVMSAGTIPNEYERRTSHLIWVRKVSQSRYHGELMLANIASGLMAELIFFLVIGVFTVIKGQMEVLATLPMAYLIVGLSTCIAAALTSLMSCVLNPFAAGFFACIYILLGIFHEVVLLLRDLVGGTAGTIIRYMMKLVPDLNGIRNQASNCLLGESISVHILLVGMLYLYIFVMALMLFKKKEA